jgi:hypothetical protein
MPSLALPAALLLALSQSQQGSPQTRPGPVFRTFSGELTLPTELINDLEQMRLFAEKHRLRPVEGGYVTSFDAEGRETCTDPQFLRLREAVGKRLERQAGWLGTIVRESPSIKARMAAYYGGFFVESVQDSVSLLSYLPGEPVAEIRQEGLRLALPFLERWIPAVQAPAPGEDQDAAAAGRPATHPGGYLPDVRTFINLMRSTSSRDCALTLDVLERCLRLQRRACLPMVEVMAPEFRQCLRAGNEELVGACRRFLATVAEDPAAAEGDASKLEQRLAAELKRLFPSIRVVSDGLIDLYPGAELDAVVRVGRQALDRGTLGAHGEIPATHNRPRVIRGLVLSAPPAELKVLGFKPGDCILSLDGSPVQNCRSLLDHLEKAVAANRKTFLVEYFSGDQVRAKEFRVR